MTLTLHYAGTCDPAGRMSFTWHLDAEDGTRWAEQAGDVCGYPPGERSPRTAAAEGLLAALEWLHPLRFAPVLALHVHAPDATRDELARPFAPDDASALCRAAAHLSLYRRRGVSVTVGESVPEPPQPAASVPVRKRPRADERRKRRAAPAHGAVYH